MRKRALTITAAVALAMAVAAGPGSAQNFPPEIRTSDGAIMLIVPAGRYAIGSDRGPSASSPRRDMVLEAFYVDRVEVTNEQFLKFSQTTGHRFPPLFKGGKIPKGAERLPVVNVDFRDAEEYARWAKKALPTEEQWEAVAGGSDHHAYPYGNIPKPTCAAIRLKKPVITGTYNCDVSPFGVMDMGGNVMEWTSSWFKSYPGAEKYFDESGRKRVVRGGHFGSKNASESVTYGRKGFAPDYKSPNLGFRCVKLIGGR